MQKMMLRLLVALLAVSWLAADEEEALSLRRIADFWEEGEFQIAKTQIETFLELFPNSSYYDTLSLSLGDLYLREKNYSLALNCYARIQDASLSEKSFLHRMQCLYHLEWHATLADECEGYLNKEGTDPESRLQATYLLAIALYQQCLDPEKSPSTLQALASRAMPYFESLFQSKLSEEAAGAFAHLQCILKNYEGASKIFVNLADQNNRKEEYLFQAALIQSKYNRDLALETFESLANGPFKEEAVYNKLVLYFEQGLFEKIIEEKEIFYSSISEDKLGLAHLFVGQSYLHLKQFAEAETEFKIFLDSKIPQERLKAAILQLVEGAVRAENTELLNLAISRLASTDPELPKALFSKALLYKKRDLLSEAKNELASILKEFPGFPMKPQVLLELGNLHLKAQEWDATRSMMQTFLNEFPEHELTAQAWQQLLSASKGDDFIQGVAQMMKTVLLSSSEHADWQFFLAKEHYEKRDFARALEILKPLFSGPLFPQLANAKLLYAFSLRDAQEDDEHFCLFAEEAMKEQATLVSESLMHLALFNSYLKQKKLESAAEHLYIAAMDDAPILPENLLWLADYLYDAQEGSPEKAFNIISKLPLRAMENGEPYLLKQAKLHNILGRPEEATALLEKLVEQYKEGHEAKVYLAKLYTQANEPEKALLLYQDVASSGHYSDPFVAESALQTIRLKLPENPLETDFARLKNIVLNKKLEHEPIYLDAALLYIDLQAKKDPAKRLPLLKKMKADFESEEDLLSKDYMASRSQFPKQAAIYDAYMQRVDAAILSEEASMEWTGSEK